MKSIIKLALVFLAINGLVTYNFIEAKLSKKNNSKKLSKARKQVHIVHDNNGFHSTLNQVIRRNPVITTEMRLGAERIGLPETTVHMSNSNTSNGPNVGTLGRTAEIVGIYFF